jgi:hypothetical protein
MRRRQFIAGLGSAAAWPVVGQAQQGDRVRRIGVLMPSNENDPEQRARLLPFTQALADLGWTDGRNVRMDLRWAGGDINRMRVLAQELVSLQPDIILTMGSTAATVAVQRETAPDDAAFCSSRARGRMRSISDSPPPSHEKAPPKRGSFHDRQLTSHSYHQ